MAKIIDGKAIAALVRAEAALETAALRAKGIVPGLAVVFAGNNPASRIYINNKKKACAAAGIRSEEHTLSAAAGQSELLALIRTLNEKKDVSGILVQLPLPHGIDVQAVLETVDPDKDVDAFHPVNAGRVMTGGGLFLPCTPAGILELLRRENISVSGKRCVIVGRSNIVGKPTAILLLRENGTVTVCHSRTEHLPEICREADLLVAAVGRPKFITVDMVKPGAVVIDVGMNRDENGKLCGDVDFRAVEPVASYITPVPGGVGPMTIAMLLKNTVAAARRQNGICDTEL